MRGVPLTDAVLREADCVVITTDHSGVDYERVVREAALVVDTRNATRGLTGGNVIGLSGSRPEDGRRAPSLVAAR